MGESLFRDRALDWRSEQARYEQSNGELGAPGSDNLHGMLSHQDELVEAVGVLFQQVGEARELQGDSTLWHSKEDDSGVWTMPFYYQPLEILIVCKENAALAFGDVQYSHIGQGGRVVTHDDGDIVSALAQEAGEAQFAVLIQQKLHAPR